MLERLAKVLHGVTALVLIPVIVVMTSLEVLMRYVFHSPLQWSEEVVTLTLLLVSVAPIPYCIARDAHVKVETLYERFGPLKRRLADAAGALSGAIFLGMLGYGALLESVGMRARDERTEIADISQWPFSAAVGLIAAFATVWLLVLTFTSLRGARQ